MELNLSEHDGWLRALARAVAPDAADADDLVQETYLAALRSARPAPAKQRGWLASILRNAARQKLRADRRRSRRERESRPPAGSASPLERVQSRARLQRLGRAVRSLREPYRTTILLRYMEGLSPGAIASRQGVPLRTVTTRISRGLATLRERLSPEFERELWGLGALPLFAALRRAPALRRLTPNFQTQPMSGLIPMVVESTPRGERAFDIFSRLLQERIPRLQAKLRRGRLDE